MTVEDFTHRGWELLLETSLKSLLLLAVAGLTLLCLRRASAAMRHLVLLLTLVCLLLLPLLSSSLPGWPVGLWPRTAVLSPPSAGPLDALTPTPSSSVTTSNPGPASPSVATTDPPSLSAVSDQTAAPVQRTPHVPWLLLGFVLWVAGVCAVLTPVLLGLVGVHRLGRRSLPVASGVVTGLAAQLGRQIGIRRSPSLLRGTANDPFAVPMTWGWRRPVVLLPSDLEDWPAERLRVVLLHELAHIRRNDWLWQMLAHVACALYWFHPGVWLVARGLSIESERACDDQVLSAGVPASDYARHLVEVARSLSQSQAWLDTALPMAQASLVEGRVMAILRLQTIRNIVTRKKLLIAVVLAVGICIPLAILRPVARAQASREAIGQPGKTDPAAVELLRQMGAAYKTLQTYSCTEVAEGGGEWGMPYRLDLAYERPGKLTFTHTRSFGQQTITRHVVLDGKTLFETSSDDVPGRYARMTKPEAHSTLWQDALMILCDVKSPITMHLLEDSDSLLKDWTKNPDTAIRLGPPSRLNGIAVDTVILADQHGGNVVMQIGQGDHLLRRITDTSGPGPNERPTTITQTFTHIRANPVLPASTFIFSPPAGAVAVDVDPSGSHADPEAVTLLARMYAASAALKSFSFTRESTWVSVRAGKTYRSPSLSRATFVIQKPGRVVMVRQSPEGEARAISDGTNLYVTTTESSGGIQALPERYLKLGIGPNDPNRLVWLSRFGNIPQYIPDEDFMPNAVLGWSSMPADMYDWKMGKPGVVNGEPVDTVTLRRDDGTNGRYDLLTLAISRRDHLLRQVSESQDAHHPLSRQVETYTHFRINPALPASLFVFQPPAGSLPVSVSGDLYTSGKERG